MNKTQATGVLGVVIANATAVSTTGVDLERAAIIGAVSLAAVIVLGVARILGRGE